MPNVFISIILLSLNQSDTGVPSGNFSCAKDGRHRKAAHTKVINFMILLLN